MSTILNTAYKVQTDLIETETGLNIEDGTLVTVNGKLKFQYNGISNEVFLKPAYINYFDFSSNVVENVEKMIIVFQGYDNLTISYTIIPDYENIIKPRIKYTNVYTSIGPQRDHTSDNNPCENIKQIIELN